MVVSTKKLLTDDAKTHFSHFSEKHHLKKQTTNIMKYDKEQCKEKKPSKSWKLMRKWWNVTKLCDNNDEMIKLRRKLMKHEKTNI